MTGLIIKDFMNLRKSVRIYAAFMVLYGGISIYSQSSSFFSSVWLMLFAILTLNLYSYDDLAKWDSYALTMPLSRDNIVQGKYMMMLILTALGVAISAIFTGVYSCLVNNGSLQSDMKIMGIGTAIVILFYCVSIPFITKSGVEKARVFILAVYMIPFVGILLIRKALERGNLVMTPHIKDLIAFLLKNLYVILPVIVLTALAVSYLISIHIYRKKEF